MKKDSVIKEGAKGVLTGASMLVPGISGGTMALIFGFYDKLINAAAGIFKSFKKNFLTILFYMLTVAVGFVAFSWPMSFLMENVGFIMYCFFVGTLIGSMALLKKKAGITSLKWTDAVSFAAGIVILLLITLIPEDFISYSSDGGFFGNLPLYIISGILIAVALILPGISLSHILIVIGLYELILEWIKKLDILSLLPFGIFGVLFVFAMIKALEYALNKQSRITYTVISGFVLFSAIDIARQNILPFIASFAATSGYIVNIVAGAAVFALGTFLTAFIAKKSKN